MTRLAFVDCETTGLDPDRHAVWEVAIITAHHDDDLGLAIEDEWTTLIQLRPSDLAAADSKALEITRFYDRYSLEEAYEPDSGYPTPERVISQVIHRTDRRHLVGAVPSFDAIRLDKLARRHGYAPTWHYHLVDVEALAAGALQQRPPWDSDDLTARLGVTVADKDRHTALGDARWALRTYQAVLYPQQPIGSTT